MKYCEKSILGAPSMCMVDSNTQYSMFLCIGRSEIVAEVYSHQDAPERIFVFVLNLFCRWISTEACSSLTWKGRLYDSKRRMNNNDK